MTLVADDYDGLLTCIASGLVAGDVYDCFQEYYIRVTAQAIGTGYDLQNTKIKTIDYDHSVGSLVMFQSMFPELCD